MAKKKEGMPLFVHEGDISTQDFELIKYEKDGPIGRIILNRPERRNAMSYNTLLEISMALMQMEKDPDIRVIVLKGTGPAFCAGYDLSPTPEENRRPGDFRENIGWADVAEPPGAQYIEPYLDGAAFYKYRFLTREIYFRMFDLLKPIIAQVHGYCLAGGTHLAAFSDIRLVAEDAQIGFPVGVNITTQALQYEVWLMGQSKAKYYLLSGEPMSGREAYEWGWASRAYPADRLEAEVEKLAAKMGKHEPVHLFNMKRALNRQIELMGFKTGMAWSADNHGGGGNGPYGGGGEPRPRPSFFQDIAEQGVAAAVKMRDEEYGIEYPARSGD